MNTLNTVYLSQQQRIFLFHADSITLYLRRNLCYQMNSFSAYGKSAEYTYSKSYTFIHYKYKN